MKLSDIRNTFMQLLPNDPSLDRRAYSMLANTLAGTLSIVLAQFKHELEQEQEQARRDTNSQSPMPHLHLTSDHVVLTSSGRLMVLPRDMYLKRKQEQDADEQVQPSKAGAAPPTGAQS